MSTWTTFRVPAALAALSSISGVAAVALPSQASLFSSLSALLMGASLHSINPNQSGAAQVQPEPVQKPEPVTISAPEPTIKPTQKVEAAPVAMPPASEAILQMVAVALQAYNDQKAGQNKPLPQNTDWRTEK